MPEKYKKVLIIAYYWPPSGGSGVQRWLKFVKYLPQFSWKPYVFTPDNPSFAVKDESLLNDVPPEAEIIRFPIWEPYEILFKISTLFGVRKSAKPTDLVSKKRSFFQTLTTWIRGNLLIPDPRIFWVRPSVNFLHQFLNDNNIETIITTGPPHSIHLIGLKLKRKNPSLRWLADFRDPWTEWGLLDSLMVGKWARKFHRRLEAKVLSYADQITTITPFYVKRFEALANRKINLLTNGFDEDDFSTMEYLKPDKFIIRHIGIINEKCDPIPFMEALEQVAQEHPEFGRQAQIEFIGEVHPQFQQFVNRSNLLRMICVFAGNIPHKELMKIYGSSSLLILILTGYKDAAGYMPGKLFEYLATGLPILAIGPVDGDAATLLKETQAGEMIDSGQPGEIKRALLQHFRFWLSHSGPVKKQSALRISRRELTAQLAELLSSR